MEIVSRFQDKENLEWINHQTNGDHENKGSISPWKILGSLLAYNNKKLENHKVPTSALYKQWKQNKVAWWALGIL